MSAGGTGSSASAITALKSDATLKKIDFQPFPANIRAKADAKVPELAQLVALGSSAVEDILNEFRRPPGLTDDVELSLLAYALEKIGDTRAIPVLATWLDNYMFAGSGGWTSEFVTHTIKVLQRQSGLNTRNYTYLVDEKFDALLQQLWDSGYEISKIGTTRVLPHDAAAVRGMIAQAGGINALASFSKHATSR